jgi:uncharacterized protein
LVSLVWNRYCRNIAGFLNTVAGGGSFLTLPALDLSWYGSVHGQWNKPDKHTVPVHLWFDQLLPEQGPVIQTGLAFGCSGTLGATAGTFIAINVDKKILNLVIAALISVMAILLVVKPGMWEAKKQTRVPKPLVWLLFFGIGVYGGFIQAGVGFFFTWALAAAVGMDLVSGNAIKTVVIGTYTW